MKRYRLAVLGATGMVGNQMVKVLEERGFPLSELRLLSSPRSAGSVVRFNGEDIVVREAGDRSFHDLDFVLGAVSATVSRQYAPLIKEAGAVFIDNSSAFRMEDDVPLVVPEINGGDAFGHHGVIANPNCSTIITMVALGGISRLTEIEKIVACTYQAVSGAGQEGMIELQSQIANPEAPAKVFPCRILSNVIPWIGSALENGYTTEEMKMQNEGRKILHLPNLKVCCTCVRVPVMRSHSIAVQFVTHDKISVEEAIKAIKNAPGCFMAEDIGGRSYPTPLDVSDQDLVYIGRVRRDLIDDERGLSLWCCGDQIRKGAAANAVQIAQMLVGRGAAGRRMCV